MSSGVSLRLETAGRTYDGVVVHTLLGQSEDGLIVSFDQDSAPQLEPGDGVSFTVSLPSLTEDVVLEGVVFEAWCEAQSKRFLFQCPTDGVDDSSDRRAAVRVEFMDAASHAVVLGLDQSWSMSPIINDVSATGISFLVPEGEEFSDIDSVVLVQLEVPGHGSVEFGGRVCYRRSVPPYDLYGVEFDARFTQEYSRKQLLMHSYVEQRVVALGLKRDVPRPSDTRLRSKEPTT